MNETEPQSQPAVPPTIEYATATQRRSRGHLWVMFVSAPFLGIGAGFLCAGLAGASHVREPYDAMIGIGVGFLVAGGVMFAASILMARRG